MKIAITGPDGFLAWHTRCALRSRQEDDIVPIGRNELVDPRLMDEALTGVDAVIHLAGVNRAEDEADIATVNATLARHLAEAVTRAPHPLVVVHGNSIHSLGDSTFGRSKRNAADVLTSAVEGAGGQFVDVLLPNIFGEHGRPFYNSFVATFCHQIASGTEPQIDVEREVPLLHAQAAASILLNAAADPSHADLRPVGRLATVSNVLQRLRDISEPYRDGHLPDLADPFTRDLFNTYRSFTFPEQWPVHPIKHADARGELVEAVRGKGGETQVFFSTTRPGFTRGEHFHLRKVERFMVLEGQATIRLRRLFTDTVVEFPVTGDMPAIIDMPTLWTHSITNTGDSNLLTLFYADDEYNPADPDTYWVAV